MLLGMISAALFYGDEVDDYAGPVRAIRPSKVWRSSRPRLPLRGAASVVILFALFAVQSRGTARVATFFGPITLLWFFALAVGGAWHVAQNPSVLGAFNPVHGVAFSSATA